MTFVQRVFEIELIVCLNSQITGGGWYIVCAKIFPTRKKGPRFGNDKQNP